LPKIPSWSKTKGASHIVCEAPPLGGNRLRILACLGGLGLALLTGACASRPVFTDVDAGLIIPAMGGQVEVPENQQFLFPQPVVRNPLPLYPDSLLALGLPDQVVCLRILIDDGGAVPSSSPVFDEPGCPDASAPPRAEFLNAARQAVARWEFLAATLCTYPIGMEKNEDCSGDGVVMRQVPVKLAYRFRFRLVEGKPLVED